MTLSPAVMMVGDEEEIANLFKSLVEGSGFESVSFTDPLLALDYFKAHHGKFSIVITDLRMPNLNGVQFARHIRDIDTSVKIILTTAFYTEEHLKSNEYESAGISLVIQKPVHTSVLLKHVKDQFTKVS